MELWHPHDALGDEALLVVRRLGTAQKDGATRRNLVGHDRRTYRADATAAPRNLAPPQSALRSRGVAVARTTLLLKGPNLNTPARDTSSRDDPCKGAPPQASPRAPHARFRVASRRHRRIRHESPQPPAIPTTRRVWSGASARHQQFATRHTLRHRPWKLSGRTRGT